MEHCVIVVVPAYRVKNHILRVIEGIGSEVNHIIVVDDACPEETGSYVIENCTDTRVQVLFHSKNMGVGGAVITGYRRALEIGGDIVVKVDGDGQMDTSRLPSLIGPIKNGSADYTKGNRFHNLDDLSAMPYVRLFGNSMLSLSNKIVTGYWDIMDPTNGFTAIHREALSALPLDKLHERYYFESDVLFRLGLNRSVVLDVAMPAIYNGENSSLKVTTVAMEFPFLALKRFVKRIAYMYFLRDFNAASIEIVVGSISMIFGLVVGFDFWYRGRETGVFTSSGSVMLSALPIIIGFQLLLSALNYDVQSMPRKRPMTDTFRDSN
jgi:dolichol-phosphate mannosyltransferase